MHLPTRPANQSHRLADLRLPVPTSRAAACVWLFVRLVALLIPALPGLTDGPEVLEVYELNR